MTTVEAICRSARATARIAGVLLFGALLWIAPDMAAAQNSPLVPPAVPATGAYLGAWVDPLGLPSNGGANEMAQMPRFNNYMLGKTVALLHVFISFGDAFPMTVLNQVNQNGSIPVLDVGCTTVDQIVSGQDDAYLVSMAQSLKQFANPIFFRWYWEMNFNNPSNTSCAGYGRGSVFIAAWRHIWTIFQQNGATNVAFVWCPLAHGDPATPYYPGDEYVDWVGADDFYASSGGAIGFQNAFGQFYSLWAGHKPMMVSATGALAATQAEYISAFQQDVPSLYPNIKAVMYFDAPGQSGNYTLTGNGVAAFRAALNSPSFTVP